MKAYVALQQFGHQSVHGAAGSRNQLQHIGAILIRLKGAFNGSDLTLDAFDSQDELGLFFDGMHSSTLTYSILPYSIAKQILGRRLVAEP
jgi:hypothetical protein